MVMIRSLLIRIFRDNSIVNPPVRGLIKLLRRIGFSLDGLTARYRPFGVFTVEMFGNQFRIFSKGDDLIASEIYYGHFYERAEFSLLQVLLERSSSFIDIGANTGIFSLFAYRSNPSVKVISVEPHPSNFDRLAKNIGLNNAQLQIALHQVAIGSAPKNIEFTIPADSGISTTASANQAFTSGFHRAAYKTIQVPQVTLDSILKDQPVNSRDIIKIDVEYYEMEVLKGSLETLKTKRPLVMIELLSYESLVHQYPDMMGRIDPNHNRNIVDLFSSIGYCGYTIEHTGFSRLELQHRDGTRNVLFVPFPLSRESYTTQSLLSEMDELSERSNHQSQ